MKSHLWYLIETSWHISDIIYRCNNLYYLFLMSLRYIVYHMMTGISISCICITDLSLNNPCNLCFYTIIQLKHYDRMTHWKCLLRKMTSSCKTWQPLPLECTHWEALIYLPHHRQREEPSREIFPNMQPMWCTNDFTSAWILFDKSPDCNISYFKKRKKLLLYFITVESIKI